MKKGSPALCVHTRLQMYTRTFLSRSCLKFISLFGEDIYAGIAQKPTNLTHTSQPGMNTACCTDNLNFSTYKFSQALEFWVEILNLSKTTSANLVFPAKTDYFFFLFKTNGNVAWILLTNSSTV